MIPIAFWKRTRWPNALGRTSWPPIVTKASGNAWTRRGNINYWKTYGPPTMRPGEFGILPPWVKRKLPNAWPCSRNAERLGIGLRSASRLNGTGCITMDDLNFFKGRRVFITGHTGFKGSWLTLWLLRHGAFITGFSLDVPTSPSLFDSLGLAADIQHVTGDLRAAEDLSCLLESEQPAFVVQF